MTDEFTPFLTSLRRWRAAAGVRRIRDGDECAFTPPSPEPLALRRASGAARIVARALLGQFGAYAEAPLTRTPARYALWPQGFVGSLAHDADYATATVARASEIDAIGVDIEPAESLPKDVVEIALSLQERREIGDDPLLARMIFCAKEAVYKAINPFDGTPLEYEDIEITLRERAARLADGRRLDLATYAGTHLLVAAISPRGALSRGDAQGKWVTAT